MLIGNQSLVTYKITKALSIQLVEMTELENSPECNYCGIGYHWNKIWPASLALSRYLAEGFSFDALKGGQALVIGCGMGLEGLVLAKLGTKLGITVTFLDHVQDALNIVYQNILLNKIESSKTICCCWQDTNNVQSIGKYDLIIASDILFYSDQWIWIKSLLETTLKPKGLMLFSEPDRFSDIMNFFNGLDKSNFKIMGPDSRWGSKDQNILIFCVEKL